MMNTWSTEDGWWDKHRFLIAFPPLIYIILPINFNFLSFGIIGNKYPFQSIMLVQSERSSHHFLEYSLLYILNLLSVYAQRHTQLDRYLLFYTGHVIIDLILFGIS